MKRFLLTTYILFSLALLQNIEAKQASFLYTVGETVSTIHKLPEECIIEEEHVNIGVLYEQFTVFWIPIWNYGTTQYVLVNDAEDGFWSVDKQTIESLKADYKFDLPEKASIPFWSRVGGKPILVLMCLHYFYSTFFARKRIEEEEDYEDME